ncbi:hypothetical protein UNSWCD_1682 [Campylobacter concisus UNSWCD]|nr:hypothetical protein UNSWCD_1682 [Campylobacter concisus UNSWCD]
MKFLQKFINLALMMPFYAKFKFALIFVLLLHKFYLANCLNLCLL